MNTEQPPLQQLQPLTKESMKGMKKRELRALCIQNTQRANAIIVALNMDIIDTRHLLDSVKAERNAAVAERDEINKMYVQTSSSFKMLYYENLELIVAIIAEIATKNWTISFDSTSIIVTFGKVFNHYGPDQLDYGVWIRDSDRGQKFILRPWLGKNHVHMEDIPCIGIKVTGVEAAMKLISDFASHKEEYKVDKTVPSSMCAIEVMREFMKPCDK